MESHEEKKIRSSIALAIEAFDVGDHIISRGVADLEFSAPEGLGEIGRPGRINHLYFKAVLGEVALLYGCVNDEIVAGAKLDQSEESLSAHGVVFDPYHNRGWSKSQAPRF